MAEEYGSFCGMAVRPTMARSSIGKGLVIPWAAMARPPTPASLIAPAVCSLSACANAAPSASPDSSPAMMWIDSGRDAWV